MFNDKYILSRYQAGDIISYEDLVASLGDGYGEPGCVEIAVLNGGKCYPAGFCSDTVVGVWNPDETEVLYKDDYGKEWVAVCVDQEWFCGDGGNVGCAYLLDMMKGE